MPKRPAPPSPPAAAPIPAPRPARLAPPAPPVRAPRAPPAPPPARPAWAAASNRLMAWSPSSLVAAAGVFPVAGGGEVAAGVPAARAPPGVPALACDCSRCTFSGMPCGQLATVRILDNRQSKDLHSGGIQLHDLD